MSDFWGLFLFGMSWLALAVVSVWLLRRAPARALSLRSLMARALAWILAVLTLAIFVVNLPYSLGFCRGGFDEAPSCSVVPVAIVEVTAPLMLLLTLAGIIAVPVLCAAILIVEGLHRYLRAGAR